MPRSHMREIILICNCSCWSSHACGNGPPHLAALQCLVDQLPFQRVSLCIPLQVLQIVPLHLMGKSFTHEDSPFEPKQGKLDHQSSRPSQTQLSWRFCSVKDFCTVQLSAQKMKTTQFWFLAPHYALCLGPTIKKPSTVLKLLSCWEFSSEGHLLTGFQFFVLTTYICHSWKNLWLWGSYWSKGGYHICENACLWNWGNGCGPCCLLWSCLFMRSRGSRGLWSSGSRLTSCSFGHFLNRNRSIMV